MRATLARRVIWLASAKGLAFALGFGLRYFDSSLGAIGGQPKTGAAKYQACDDKVCFTPQSVPLTWTIGLRALDRERVKQP